MQVIVSWPHPFEIKPLFGNPIFQDLPYRHLFRKIWIL
jgi:hypothetical protein